MKFLCLLALIPSLAIATGTPSAPHASTSHASSASTSNAKAVGIGGTATANTGDSNANNSIRIEDRLQAPSLLVGAVYPSGVCSSGGSLALTIPGGGIAGGRSKHENESCAKREWFRLLSSAGANALALKVACSDPLVKAVAAEGDCDYKPVPPPQPCAVCKPEDTYTKSEVDAKLDRVYKSSVSK